MSVANITTHINHRQRTLQSPASRRRGFGTVRQSPVWTMLERQKAWQARRLGPALKSQMDQLFRVMADSPLPGTPGAAAGPDSFNIAAAI